MPHFKTARHGRAVITVGGLHGSSVIRGEYDSDDLIIGEILYPYGDSERRASQVRRPQNHLVIGSGKNREIIKDLRKLVVHSAVVIPVHRAIHRVLGYELTFAVACWCTPQFKFPGSDLT
jgi:hypothetical protein